ncbi:hypothetical protein GCM10023340_18290 [Nocardioides marinquilinus]|uniref:Uncharacterized protein n=1 Tax=Nocardioides marinquilinus TaxID=1210400 RepID=A0ABP9PKC6_9ACTN
MKRLLALLAAVAVCVGLTVAPASAERVTGRDGRADVTRTDDDGTSTVAWANFDVVRYAVRYGEHRISAVVRFRSLVPGRDVFAMVYLRPPGRRDDLPPTVAVTAGRGHRAGTSVLIGVERRCRPRHRVDYRRDLVRMSFPARCLGRPRYVDASVLSIGFRSLSRPTYVDIAPGTARDYQRSGSGVDFPTVRVRRG